MSKNWTMKEIEFLKINWDLLEIKEITKELNRSISSIYSMKHKLGLVKGLKRFTTKEKEKIIELYKLGYTHNGIARIVKSNKQSISQFLSDLRKKGISIVRYEKENTHKNYTAEELEIIKNKYQNTKAEYIAIELGRTPRAIQRQARILGIKKDDEFLKQVIKENYKKWKHTLY